MVAKVEPDIRALADGMDELGNAITVLASAAQPLQGATERLGRVVDRLPGGARRTPARGAPNRPAGGGTDG
jgi:hypothetical protein